VYLAFHIDVGLLRGNLGNGGNTHCRFIPFVYNFVIGKIDPGLVRGSLDLVAVSHENGLGETGLAGLFNCREQPRLLRHGNGNLLGSFLGAYFFCILEKL